MGEATRSILARFHIELTNICIVCGEAIMHAASHIGHNHTGLGI